MLACIYIITNEISGTLSPHQEIGLTTNKIRPARREFTQPRNQGRFTQDEVGQSDVKRWAKRNKSHMFQSKISSSRENVIDFIHDVMDLRYCE